MSDDASARPALQQRASAAESRPDTSAGKWSMRRKAWFVITASAAFWWAMIAGLDWLIFS